MERRPVVLSPAAGAVTGFWRGMARADLELLSAQRMGGLGYEEMGNVAVLGGIAYLAGRSASLDGDYPAGLPTQNNSAFVPCSNETELFVMKLNVDAPIVQVANTDITAPEDTPVTLNATTSGHHRVVRVGSCR